MQKKYTILYLSKPPQQEPDIMSTKPIHDDGERKLKTIKQKINIRPR